MKTCGVRLEDIGDWPALRATWHTYRSGKRQRPSVAQFEIDADQKLLHLSREILSQTYRHGAYRLLPIYDPKARLIAVAPVRDRIVHAAVYQALGPFFNRSLVSNTYACLVGRGSHRAVLAYLQGLRSYAYCVHLDIRRYYPSVDHQILRGLLLPKLRDDRIGALLDHLIQSGWSLYQQKEVRTFFKLPALEAGMRPAGLPIGNMTSQWWGNLYLDGLDHFIKRELKLKGFVRYMDDVACFGDSRAELKRARREIEDWLAHHRRLEINERKAHILPARTKRVWLGQLIRREGIDLGPKAIRRFRSTLSAEIEPEKLWRQLSAGRYGGEITRVSL